MMSLYDSGCSTIVRLNSSSRLRWSASESE